MLSHPPVWWSSPQLRRPVIEYLCNHTCYDAMPMSSKVVVFDMELPVKDAFHVAHEHGLVVAVLLLSSLTSDVCVCSLFCQALCSPLCGTLSTRNSLECSPSQISSTFFCTFSTDPMLSLSSMISKIITLEHGEVLHVSLSLSYTHTFACASYVWNSQWWDNVQDLKTPLFMSHQSTRCSTLFALCASIEFIVCLWCLTSLHCCSSPRTKAFSNTCGSTFCVCLLCVLFYIRSVDIAWKEFEMFLQLDSL